MQNSCSGYSESILVFGLAACLVWKFIAYPGSTFSIYSGSRAPKIMCVMLQPHIRTIFHHTPPHKI